MLRRQLLSISDWSFSYSDLSQCICEVCTYLGIRCVYVLLCIFLLLYCFFLLFRMYLVYEFMINKIKNAGRGLI